MKKHLLVALAIISAIGTQAATITVDALSDSLNQFVVSKANIGRVRVQTYREQGKNIYVYTNTTLRDASFTPEEVQRMREIVSMGVRGDKDGKVSIFTGNQEIGSLITSRYQNRPASERHTLRPVTPLVSNASRAYTAGKGLDGKHIALWGSHGLYYVQDYRMWKWQRARLWTTVEDLYTSSYTRNFVVPMLENAGAVVIQPRERDIQLHEVIVDDNQAAGAWTPGTKAGWSTPDGPIMEGENPFTTGHYVMRKCSDPIAELRYTPAIPEAGDYAVYISYATEKGSTDAAKYTIMHDGIESHYLVNQQMGGGTWIYIGTFHFGTNAAANYVAVSNEGNAKYVVTSDAVRFGGGMGSVARYPQPGFVAGVAKALGQIEEQEQVLDSAQLALNKTRASVSGFPRYIEGARYWMQYSGIPDSVYNFTQSRNDYIDDYASRGRWVTYLAGGSQAYPKGPGLNIPINLSMAFHSDAGTYLDDRIVGTLMAYTPFDNDNKTTYPAGGSRMCNRDLADFIQGQIVEDIQHTMCPTWPRRRLWDSNYAESRNPKVPCALLELLSHQNYADMIYGLEPEFKFIVGRAIYKAMVKFLHAMDGTPYVIQPLPVEHFGMDRKGNQVNLHWDAQLDSLEETATPTYYIVYTREEGKDWDNGQKVTANQWSMALESGKLYDFKVCAANKGGQSMPSEILSACLFEDKATAMIINGFHRTAAPDMAAWDSLTGGIQPYSHAIPYGTEISYLGEQFDYDRMNPWHSDDDCGFGMNFSDQSTKVNVGNTFDYPHMHGVVLQQMGISFISSSADAIHDLKGFQLVDIIMGKQKGPRHVVREGKFFGTTNEQGCIPTSLRQPMEDYLNQGGHMLLTGSYIASNMQGANDTAFIHNVLHYKYKSARASNCGKLNIMYETLPNRQLTWVMEPNSRIIECEAPDGIDIENGSVRVARYDDCGLGAGIAYENGKERLMVFGLMMESVNEFDSLYKDCIEWLNK